MAGQALAEPEDVSSVTAIMLCKYLRELYEFGKTTNSDVNSFSDFGRRFLGFGWETIFVNRLVGQLIHNVPGVDPSVVAAVGATGLRQAFTDAELPGILLSYVTALKSVFAFTIALAGTATVIGAFSSWKSIKVRVMGVA
jgi:hypothetical protein